MTRAPLSQLDDWVLENKDQDIRGRTVKDESGTPIGKVDEMIVNTDTGYVDAIVLEDGAEIPTSDIRIENDAVYLRRAEYVEPAEGVVAEDTAPARDVEGEAVVPIVSEEMRVGKREVDRGGVRVTRRVEEQPVSEQVTLRDETTGVHREKVDRPATEADLAAMQEGTFEVREHDEEAVVDKQARVVEEVVINKDVQEHTENIQDTVRRTDVDVKDLGEREQGR
jgi:uncharacterized protein (TIGR02271 family)